MIWEAAKRTNSIRERFFFVQTKNILALSPLINSNFRSLKPHPFWAAFGPFGPSQRRFGPFWPVSGPKLGKLAKNVELWQDAKEASEEQTGGMCWIKVPSRTDMEGDEPADGLAKEGVRKHGVTLQEGEKNGPAGGGIGVTEEEPGNTAAKGSSKG